MHSGRGRHQPVDDGDRVRDVQSAPFVGDRFIDGKNAIGMFGHQPPEPSVENACRPGVPASDALDSSPNLADAENGEKNVFRRDTRKPPCDAGREMGSGMKTGIIQSDRQIPA